MLVQLYVYNGRKAQVNQVVQPLSRGHVESYNCPHEDCHKMGVPPFLDGPIVHIIDWSAISQKNGWCVLII